MNDCSAISVRIKHNVHWFSALNCRLLTIPWSIITLHMLFASMVLARLALFLFRSVLGVNSSSPPKKKPQELKHYSSYLQLSTTIQHLATPLQLSLSWSYSAESKLTSAPKLAWPIWPILSRAFCTQTGSRYGSNFTGWYISADKWALGSPWLEQYFIHLTLKPGGWTHMKWVGMLVVSLRGVHFRILVSLRVFWAKRHHI